MTTNSKLLLNYTLVVSARNVCQTNWLHKRNRVLKSLKSFVNPNHVSSRAYYEIQLCYRRAIDTLKAQIK